PIVLSLLLLVGQQLLMLFMPVGAYGLVLLSAVLEAVALSMLSPMTTSLQMLNIEREERARMLGFFYAMCMLVTSPLSTVAGMLAEINRTWPFVLNLVLTLMAVWITMKLWKLGLPEEEEPVEA
ncbi:MAG: hypothetical protein RSC91_11600, partial [Clostridia bacterium]